MTRLIVITTFLFSFSINAFTLNTSTGARFEEDEVTVKIADNCANINTTTEELLAITVEAVDRYWNKIPSSRLTLTAGPIVSVDSAFYTEGLCSAQGANGECTPNENIKVPDNILISCNESTANFADTELNVFATTLPNNADRRTIHGAILIINDRAGNVFGRSTREQKIIVIAHEIGHAIGLGHTEDNDTLMYYQLQDISRTALSWDDINGLTYLYPAAQPDIGTCGTIAPVGGDGSGPKNFLIMFSVLLMVVLVRKRKFS